jgi:hypothetical protein
MQACCEYTDILGIMLPKNGVVILSPYTFYPERDSAFIHRGDSRGGRLAESGVLLSSLGEFDVIVDTAAIVLLTTIAINFNGLRGTRFLRYFPQLGAVARVIAERRT